MCNPGMQVQAMTTLVDLLIAHVTPEQMIDAIQIDNEQNLKYRKLLRNLARIKVNAEYNVVNDQRLAYF